MAEAPKRWKNRDPLAWDSAPTADAAVPSATESPYANPADFDINAPVPGRPSVPDLEEQIPQNAKDNSLLGSFLNVMDNIVPDDMGGLVRGSSGWLGNVPLYEETVGRVAGAPLSAAETALNVVNWGSEQMNHLGAALFSALPGGIQTLDWEQAQDISTGQVLTANSAINAGDGAGGWLINIFTSPITSIATTIGQNQDPGNVLYSDEFNILDPEMREEAFSEGAGMWSSGILDAIWLVAADPTIVGGKVTNVIRFGTKVGEFGGMTNQALRTADQVERFANTLDEQAAIIAELGVEGARSSGRLTAEGENLISAMEGQVDDLVNHPWVKNSTSKRDTRALLAEVTTADPIEAANLAGALAGNPASWGRLRTDSAELYDAAARAMNIDIFGPTPGAAVDPATIGVRMTDDQIGIADDITDEVLATGVDVPVRPSDMDVLPAGQMIERGGSRVGARTTRAANAWRRGARSNQFSNNAFKKSSSVNPTKGNYTYDVIEGIAGSRPVRVVRWLGQGTPNGIVNLKNGADSSTSLDEVSAYLRKSPIDQARASAYINEFAAARDVNTRKSILERIEQDTVDSIAAKQGVPPETARKLYNQYAARRGAVLDNSARSKNNISVDPDTGEIIKMPDFYAELDQAYPLVDIKMFSRVIKDNPWLRTSEDVSLAADYINSLWKVSVLARLGYTQRNLAEGALRSFAVLGAIAANPKALAQLPSNAKYYALTRRGVKGIRAKEKNLMGSYDDLQNARNFLDEGLEVARFDEMQRLRFQANDIETNIKNLRLADPVKNAKEIRKLQRRAERLTKDADGIRDDFVLPMIPELTESRQAIAAIEGQIDNLSNEILDSVKKVREISKNRKTAGRQGNVMDDGTELLGAFQGGEGAIAALASSADRTAYMTFNAGASSRIQALDALAEYKPMDPRKLKPEQMQVYFDEYTLRINNRYREDTVGKMVLEDRPVEDIKAWLLSPAGSSYRQNLSIAGRRLDSEQQVDAYVDSLVRRLDNEMPSDTNLRQMALDHELTSAEVAAALRGRELPVIPGRLADEVLSPGLGKRTKRGIDTVTDTLMRYLGSIPETKMLRHPFYDNIYRAKQAELWKRGVAQGQEVSSEAFKAGINTASHRAALKATKETLYTIDRLSNAATMLRFVSPFFPAFENSIRTWGRLAWQNPALIGEGNLLWNIPNNFGWVVDKNGEKVERSNFLKDEGNYIIWPEAVANVLKSKLGPFTPGEALMTPQQGFNVLFPGGNFWFPGVGPATQIPTAWLLRTRPEDAEIIRNAVGEEMFRQLVPGGNPNADLTDALLPTGVRRMKQMLSGDTSDTAFLTNWNQMIEDEYITAQLEGRTMTEADMKKVQEKADRFWRWQVAAAYVMPFQSKSASKYQLERDAWNRLIDDETLSYQEKLKRFNDQYPGFDAITRSGSYTETKLQPNLSTWQKITKNPETVDRLYAINPELVGMFGNMGSFDDPFSYSVYGEFQNMRIGPNQAKVSRKMTPQEIIRNNQLKDGWSEYWQVKDYVEEQVIKNGYSSLQVKDAEPFRQILEDAAVKLGERYPAWGEERKSYEDKLPDFINGARIIAENPELVGEDTTIATLRDYLEVREYVSDALKNTDDQDARDELKLVGYEAAWKLRQKDIGFADFYDQYLYRDDFRSI
jgi:hypothetical protein